MEIIHFSPSVKLKGIRVQIPMCLMSCKELKPNKTKIKIDFKLNIIKLWI